MSLNKQQKEILNKKVDELKETGLKKKELRRDPDTIERRRKNVWEMLSEGIPIVTMASILKVTRQTIASDIDFLKKKHQSKTNKLRLDIKEAEADIGDTAQRLSDIATVAKIMASSEDIDFQDKLKCLDSAARALISRHKVLMESGILPKAGTEIKATVTHQRSFEERYGKELKIMDDTASRHKILAMYETLLKLQDETTKTIDAKVINPEKSN